eukprot:4921155-Prymnesium_polylepis.1
MPEIGGRSFSATCNEHRNYSIDTKYRSCECGAASRRPGRGQFHFWQRGAHRQSLASHAMS